MIEELKALKELLDAGVITQAEFDAKKKQLLAQPIQQPTQQAQPVQPQYAQQGPASGSATSEKSKVAAGLLALFLGWLGVHKFYLGYSTQGVIHILITFLGALLIVGPAVCGIISLVEGIIYLTKSDEEFQRIYVQGKKVWF